MLVFVFFLISVAFAELALERISRIQLPYDIQNGNDILCWDIELAEEIVYDPQNVIAYVSGGDLITVIDIANPETPQILDRQRFTKSDVQLCGDILATVAYNPRGDALNGTLQIFSPFNATTGVISLLNVIDICSEPDHLIFTPDCSNILVACSGKPGLDLDNKYINPEGAVAIIDTENIATAGVEAVRIADFRKFNDRADEFVEAGVRYVYSGQVSPQGAPADTFSRDLEPEYVATSLDGSIGYVACQANNAMAYLNITSGDFYDIKSFGYKEWGAANLTLDASDDDDAINMQPWMIRSLYTPDVIDVFEHEGVEYIITANEGNSKEIEEDEAGVLQDFSEEIDGEDLAQYVKDPDLKMALSDEAMLGGMTFSKFEGAYLGGDDQNVYTYGGRSVSIWEAATLTLVYDSGDLIERTHKTDFPDIFNMNAVDEFCPTPDKYPKYGSTQEEIVANILLEIQDNIANDPDYEIPDEFEALMKGPKDGFDQRSDAKGPEPESVVHGMVGDRRLMFVGNERTSTIFMFDITIPSEAFLIDAIYDGAIEGTWWDQLVAGTVGPIDPEGLLFISAEQFPGNEPILMVSSALAGGVHLFRIVDKN
eukprot:TRINITY_DN959_c0_g1_i3.p1 TRINITY_DN959_c0_g1~~TRINITY_DN959_c0_g1_i3.p1  ORF type:complete len:598 (-),score=129.10 TRINITY_DN959_c0_g1_i3:166-1959(-)